MVYELQKACLWKRIAAWLFDGILLSILAVGLAFLLSLAFHYNRYSDQISDAYLAYESSCGVSLDISQEEYENLSPADKLAYDSAYEMLIRDEDVLYAYNMAVNLSLVITSISILAAALVLEFIVPLFFKNGQTLGKKIFSLCLVRSDGVKINTLQLFTRTVLGKFTIEIMIPVYIILMLFWGITDLSGTLVLGGLLLAEMITLIVSQRNAAIHDLLAGTAVADFSGQMIFESEEELIAFKKKIHSDWAAKQDY